MTGEKPNYLVVIRYNPDLDSWVVDEDSRHILEEDGGGYTIQELSVETLRALSENTFVEKAVR